MFPTRSCLPRSVGSGRFRVETSVNWTGTNQARAPASPTCPGRGMCHCAVCVAFCFIFATKLAEEVILEQIGCFHWPSSIVAGVFVSSYFHLGKADLSLSMLGDSPIPTEVVTSGICWLTLNSTTVLPQSKVTPDHVAGVQGPPARPPPGLECGPRPRRPARGGMDSSPGPCDVYWHTEPRVGPTVLRGSEIWNWTSKMES